MKRHSKLNRITLYDVLIALIVVMITVLVVYPLYYTVIASFSDPNEVYAGNTFVWIKGFTVDAYRNILKEKEIWVGYRNTIFYTLTGTLYNLFLTIPAAYVMTKKDLPFRGFISWFFFLTMYVSGGMIPGYFLVKSLGLINNPLVMIVGAGVSCYNLIVTRQYFSTSIPSDLYEAAYIDGADDGRCFVRIALPLAKPIVAVMALYYGVGRWNDYYTGLLYIYKSKYFSLQQVLNKILNSNLELKIDDGMDSDMIAYALRQYHAAQGMKYSIIFIGCLPLLIAYPFLQKYFAKGIMIGSVKG
jgi:putative aldouronate transport system permease protein